MLYNWKEKKHLMSGGREDIERQGQLGEEEGVVVMGKYQKATRTFKSKSKCEMFVFKPYPSEYN